MRIALNSGAGLSLFRESDGNRRHGEVGIVTAIPVVLLGLLGLLGQLAQVVAK